MLRLLLFVLLLNVAASAQQAITVGRELIVDVFDRETMEPVDQVSPEGFQVKVSGKTVEVISAKRMRVHARVAVIVDTNARMAVHQEKWDSSFLIVNNLMRDLESNSSLSLFFSAGGVVKTLPSRLSADERASGVKAVYERRVEKVGHGPSQIAKAMQIAIASEQLQSGDAIVVIPSGNGPGGTADKSLIAELRKRGVRVFGMVVVNEAPTTPEERAWPLDLDDNLAAPSGGRTWIVDSRDRSQLGAFSNQLVKMITQPCIIKLALSETDAGKLDVKYRVSKYHAALVFAPKELQSIESSAGR